MELTFQVLDNANVGTTDIQLVVKDGLGKNFVDNFAQALPVTISSSSVTIAAPVSNPVVSTPQTPKPTAVLPFSDLSSTDWFLKEVTYVWENGLMNGVSSDLFQPNAQVFPGAYCLQIRHCHGI